MLHYASHRHHLSRTTQLIGSVAVARASLVKGVQDLLGSRTVASQASHA